MSFLATLSSSVTLADPFQSQPPSFMSLRPAQASMRRQQPSQRASKGFLASRRASPVPRLRPRRRRDHLQPSMGVEEWRYRQLTTHGLLDMIPMRLPRSHSLSYGFLKQKDTESFKQVDLLPGERFTMEVNKYTVSEIIQQGFNEKHYCFGFLLYDEPTNNDEEEEDGDGTMRPTVPFFQQHQAEVPKVVGSGAGRKGGSGTPNAPPSDSELDWDGAKPLQYALLAQVIRWRKTQNGILLQYQIQGAVNVERLVKVEPYPKAIVTHDLPAFSKNATQPVQDIDRARELKSDIVDLVRYCDETSEALAEKSGWSRLAADIGTRGSLERRWEDSLSQNGPLELWRMTEAETYYWLSFVAQSFHLSPLEQLASFQYGTTDERLEYVVRTLRRKANELSARKSLMELMAPKKKGDTDGGSEASEAGDDPQPKT
ncbi:unnamed protein product [Vitrella brassicaformis CCMP3155]|uniref:Uncharacterized protein n=1 Tax=Vitrella brassicaformis (strain CCMP3155) TaxID=1169540 RepID=A0A0G4EJN9_VITBC|nr:unnamed protein product [Vitrella brassicaformis CCMP3155]|eukprot:CEL97645.1 unnamed protein product [Vitrella brassicaformis CCMP3155]